MGVWSNISYLPKDFNPKNTWLRLPERKRIGNTTRNSPLSIVSLSQPARKTNELCCCFLLPEKSSHMSEALGKRRSIKDWSRYASFQTIQWRQLVCFIDLSYGYDVKSHDQRLVRPPLSLELHRLTCKSTNNKLKIF